MLVILFLTYLPDERHELGTYKIESEVVSGNTKAHAKTLLLRNYPPIFLLTYGDAEACPDAV